MKKIISTIMSAIMIVTFSFGTCSVFGVKTVYAATTNDRKTIAEKLVADLGNGKYKQAAENYKYSEKMKMFMTESQLMTAMEGSKSQTGSFKKVISSTEQQNNDLKSIIVDVLNENSENLMTITFNKKDEIDGIHFIRAKALDDPTFYGQNIVFGGEKFKLNGTLNLPNQMTDTLVIIVHGSGAGDRNLTIGPNKIYLDMAKDLTSKGVATFRYDKRNYTYPSDYYSGDTSIWGETIEDALHAVRYFRNSGQFKHIYLLGHSQGGYVIPMIDKMPKDVNVDGYISFAGSVALPLEDLAYNEVEYKLNLDGKITPDEASALQEVKVQVNRVKGLTKASNYGMQELLGFTKDFWLSLKGYNPIEDAKLMTKPVLVLNGDRDYQVTKEQFGAYKKELGSKINYTFKLYNGLNHLFCYGTEKTDDREYYIKSRVDSQVTEDIANWVKKNNVSLTGLKPGWNSVSGSWVYCDNNGFKKIGWQHIDKDWYYFNNDGFMSTGWLKYGDKWYYLEKNGEMVTGWDFIDRDWYYFYNDGHMASNTIIEKCEIGSNGVAKK